MIFEDFKTSKMSLRSSKSSQPGQGWEMEALEGIESDYLGVALVVDFEIFRRSAIWGDCRRVQIAVFVR